jgi:small subunit ribosomal protein S15
MDYSTKKDIIKDFQNHTTDTGSSAVQIAIFTKKIKEIQEHLAGNMHDKEARRALLSIINKRRKLLQYLLSEDSQRFEKVVKELGLERDIKKIQSKHAVSSSKAKTLLTGDKKAPLVAFEE